MKKNLMFVAGENIKKGDAVDFNQETGMLMKAKVLKRDRIFRKYLRFLDDHGIISRLVYERSL